MQSSSSLNIDRAVRLYISRDFRGAEKILKDIIRRNNRAHDALHLLGLVRNKKGRRGLAIKSIKKAISIAPEVPAYYNNLGEVYRSDGEYELAIYNYRKAISLDSKYAKACNNLGCAQYDAGSHLEAIHSFKRAIDIDGDYAEAYSNCGNALRADGQLAEALVCYGKAIFIRPNFAEAYNNQGVVMKEMGDLDSALSSCNKAIQIMPDYVEAYNNLGNIFGDLGEFDKAITNYKRAIQLKPNYVEAFSNICDLYEKNNIIDGLREAVLHAQQVLPEDNPTLNYRLAQLASREFRFEDALGYLECIDPMDLSLTVRQGHSELLAKTYDKLGMFSSAYSQFETANNIASQSPTAKQFSSQRYLNRIMRSTKDWSNSSKIRWPAGCEHSSQISPVFLVGFPRSGTTLLDTIMMSHPDVAVVEERPMVAAMRAHIGDIVTPELLSDLDNDQVNGLRDLYFKELHPYINRDDINNKLIIDKLPLNIADIGLINRVFPDAKFIFALRHPYDCILSCFMQNFKLNDAMSNFLTLNQTAVLYDAVMTLWDDYNRMLYFGVFTIKYEDLICDVRGTLDPLLHFLSLDWDDNLINYQNTALKRGKINTPSYNQVTQGLYKYANGRWKNYRPQIKEIFPLIEPWVRKFGYSTES